MKTKTLAYLLLALAFITSAFTFYYKIIGTKKKIKNIAQQTFQTKVFYEARKEGFDLAIKTRDIEVSHVDCRLFNINPNYWIIYLNRKIGLLDVNLLTTKINKVIDANNYSNLLWELTKLIEIGKVMRFEAVEIKVKDGVLYYNGKKMEDDNYKIILVYLIESINNK